ncbi:TATA element modulatory factor [Nematostella vectensis]|uniref:TATA element modulatory factor n=1 Tax=Nematostella vectensis TaxID=45351 RepID=UPI0020776403|nr:TATA element modulatory factor [Nematostella vectensis]
MSWFATSSFTSFAKSALEEAQKSIDKVLDIDEGTESASQSAKADPNVSKMTAKQSKLEGKADNPKKTSSQSTPLQQSNPESKYQSNGGGDFWSSFLGDQGGSEKSTKRKTPVTKGTTSVTKETTSVTKGIISVTKGEASITIGAPLVTKERTSFTKETTLVNKRAMQDTKEVESVTKSATSVLKSTASITKVSDTMASVTKTSPSSSSLSTVSSSKALSSSSVISARPKGKKELQGKSSDTILGAEKETENKKEPNRISDMIKTEELTLGKGLIDNSTGPSFDRAEEESISHLQHDLPSTGSSIINSTAKSVAEETSVGTPDILQNIDGTITTNYKENNHYSTITKSAIKPDIEKCASSKEPARQKSPDMVDGLDNFLSDKVKEGGAAKAFDSESLELDLVTSNGLVYKTSDVPEPVAASTPYQTRELRDMDSANDGSSLKKHTDKSNMAHNAVERFSTETTSVCRSVSEESQSQEPISSVLVHDESFSDTGNNALDLTTEFHSAMEDSVLSREPCEHDSDITQEKEVGSILTWKDSALWEQELEDESLEGKAEDEPKTYRMGEKTIKGDQTYKNRELDGKKTADKEKEKEEEKRCTFLPTDKQKGGDHSTEQTAEQSIKNLEALVDVCADGVNESKMADLEKEISSLREIVDARERKMVQLSKDNIDLQETNAILRSQLEQLESMQHSDNAELDQIREEFTIRVAATENKLHLAAKERDQLKKELEDTTAHLTSINERHHEEFTTLLSEKDEQIAELLAEGEKLSKQELQSNTIIKKLRAKEKENDALIKKQTKKIEELDSEVKRMTEVLTSRDDSHCKQEDAIIKLDAYAKKQQEELVKLKAELDDANEKNRSLQTTLDNAYKELTELHKDKATRESTTKEAVLSAEMKAKENLRMALEKARRDFDRESEQMALQISDLQASLSRAEQKGTRREDGLRQEITDLQQRLQEADARNQELATSVSNATRPLLRQIENLQSTHSNQASSWEKVERNLTERLNEFQSQLLEAQEKERLASQSALQAQNRLSSVESQVRSYRTDRSRLEAELELERSKIRSLEDTLSREQARAEASLTKIKKLLEEANQDKAHAEQQLAVEKSRMETERTKLKAALDEKEKRLSRQSSFGSFPPPSPTTATADDGSQENADSTSQRGHARMSITGSSVVDGLARGIMGGATAPIVERLQAQVRAKEGEIDLLQEDLVALEKSRDSVTEELARVTDKMERLEADQEELISLRAQYKELEQRYNAVLQMYGEKEEEAEELRMDLHDVKAMYKQQLEQLFASR